MRVVRTGLVAALVAVGVASAGVLAQDGPYAPPAAEGGGRNPVHVSAAIDFAQSTDEGPGSEALVVQGSVSAEGRQGSDELKAGKQARCRFWAFDRTADTTTVSVYCRTPGRARLAFDVLSLVEDGEDEEFLDDCIDRQRGKVFAFSCTVDNPAPLP